LQVIIIASSGYLSDICRKEMRTVLQLDVSAFLAFILLPFSRHIVKEFLCTFVYVFSLFFIFILFLFFFYFLFARPFSLYLVKIVSLFLFPFYGIYFLTFEVRIWTAFSTPHLL
jgi:hypothetical protein